VKTKKQWWVLAVSHGGMRWRHYVPQEKHRGRDDALEFVREFLKARFGAAGAKAEIGEPEEVSL